MLDQFGRLPNDVINHIKDFYQTPIFSLKESDDHYNKTNKWVNLVITYPDGSAVEFDMYTSIQETHVFRYNKYINDENYDKIHKTYHGKSIEFMSDAREINHVEHFIEDMKTNNIHNDYMYESYYYYCGDSNDSSDEEPDAMRIRFCDQNIIIGHSKSSYRIVLPIGYKDALMKVFCNYLEILNKYPSSWD